MCFICDGGTYDELHAEWRQRIDNDGWALVAVRAEQPDVGWAYAVGLTESFGHPEVIMTGICCASCAGGLLNDLAEEIRGGRRLDAGDEVVCRCGCERTVGRIAPVHPAHWDAGRFDSWRQYYGDRDDAPLRLALQVVRYDGTHRRWQDSSRNRRWPLDRLDRAPHIHAFSRRRLQ